MPRRHRVVHGRNDRVHVLGLADIARQRPSLAWLAANPIPGGLAAVVAFVLGSLCFFPVALLSLGAGYAYIGVYGLGPGTFYAFVVCHVGCLLGSAVCFARSRFLMRRLVERFAVRYPVVRACGGDRFRRTWFHRYWHIREEGADENYHGRAERKGQ